MFERFTDRARKVMALANQEAQRLNHEYIGTEHILLGLVKEGSGVGATALRNLNVDLNSACAEVESLIKPGPKPISSPSKLPQTPQAKNVIEYAIQIAPSLNHNYVGTEHMLLGLFQSQDCAAAGILKQRGITFEQVREEVLKILGGGVSDVGEAFERSPKAKIFDGFTYRARRVMALANQEAIGFNHEYIGTEHILLGLVKEGIGGGANVLKMLHIDLNKVRAEVDKLIKRGSRPIEPTKLPQTPRVKKVIIYAMEESKELKHEYVGTEHILLGLLRDYDNVASQILMNLGLTLEQVRAEVLKLSGTGVESEKPQ